MIERILNRLFKRREIPNCEGSVYLKRWLVIRTEPFAIFLHKFERSDEDRALHDHPWPFITFILWRGYIEHYWARGKQRLDFRGPLTIHYRPATHMHRVELVEDKPAWTIVIRFRKKRDWGFWENGKWIQWNKWWQDKCE